LTGPALSETRFVANWGWSKEKLSRTGARTALSL
jgi:hypothetical protein